MGKIKAFAKNLGGVISKNSPHILTGIGCTGLISTAILAAKASPKALQILEEEERYRKRNNYQPIDTMDKIKLTWKCFIPAGAVGATSIACIIGANTVNTRRNAALASLYALSETAFRDYKTKVVEEIGRSKETKIRDEIVQDTIVANPVTASIPIYTGAGDSICYDVISNTYFNSSYEFIRQQVNTLNYRLRNEMWLDLNDYYDLVGIPMTKLGSMVGFDIDDGQIDPFYSTCLDALGRPCMSISLDVRPKHH